MAATTINFADKLSFMQQVEGFGIMIESIYKEKTLEIAHELLPYYDHVDLINNSGYSDETKNLAHLFLKYSITPRQEMLFKSLDHMRKVRNMAKMIGIGRRREEKIPKYVLPVEEVRQIPFEDIYEFHKVKINKSGFTAICPFHSENTPSFSVRNNKFKCFGCGKAGDTIQFVMDLYGFSFTEAVRWIIKIDRKSERSI